MSKFSRRWSLKLDFDATVFFTLRFDDFFGSDSKTWSSNGASSRDFSRQIKIAQNIKIFVDNFHDFSYRITKLFSIYVLTEKMLRLPENCF